MTFMLCSPTSIAKESMALVKSRVFDAGFLVHS